MRPRNTRKRARTRVARSGKSRRAGKPVNRQYLAWLASLPGSNPNPVLQATIDGIVRYRNPAAARTPGWRYRVGGPLPKNIRDLVSQALASGNQASAEVTFGSHVFLVWAVINPTGAHANIYARDITDRKNAEELLAAQHRNLRVIFDVVNVGMLLLNPDGAVSRVNNTLSKWLGKDLSGLLGSQPGDVLGCANAVAQRGGCGNTPQCGRCPIRRAFESVLRSGKPAHGAEARAVLIVGGKEVDLWLDVSADPLTIDGRPQVLLALNNVTARKQAQEALHRSETMLRGVLDQMPSGVIVRDARTGETVLSNVAGRKILEGLATVPGDPGRYVSFRPDGTPYGPDDSPLARSMHKGQIVDSEEVRCVRTEGTRVTLSVHSAPVRSADGKVTMGVAVFHDVTDRTLAQQALQESEERYRRLFESLSEEVHFWRLVRDEQGRIKTWRLVDANSPALKTWGRELSDIRGKTADEIFGPGATEHYMPVVQKIMSEGAPRSFEDYFPNLDKHFRFTSIPLGEYFITTCTDITDIKKSEGTLREANVELERHVAQRTSQLNKAVETARGERQRLYDMFESLPVYVVLLTPDYHVSFANRFFRERFGESNGRRCFEYLFGRTEPCAVCETFTVLKTDKPHHWEWIGPDGRDYDIHDYPFTDSNGSRMIMEMGIDVTLAKQRMADLNQTVDVLQAEVRRRIAAESDFQRLTGLMQMVVACNEAIVRSTDETSLLRQACRAISQVGGYRMTWVGFAEDDPDKTVRPVVAEGFEDGYLSNIKITWADNDLGRGPTGIAIRTGQICTCDDFLSDPALAPWREQALKRGFRSSIALPLNVGGRTIGALMIYSPEPGAFDSQKAVVLRQLADDLSFGIASLRAEHYRTRLEREVVEATQREQHRIGHDLHDSIQGALVGIDMMLGAHKKGIMRQLTYGELVSETDAVSKVVKQALDQTRGLARGLCPANLKGEGLARALADLTRTANLLFRVSCRFHHDPAAETNDETVAMHLYHIAQEALNNAMKHAQASLVAIRLERRDGRLCLEVEDDGVGMPRTVGVETDSEPFAAGPGGLDDLSKSGMGLRILRYRANLIGAELEIVPGAARGTLVRCLLSVSP